MSTYLTAAQNQFQGSGTSEVKREGKSGNAVSCQTFSDLWQGEPVEFDLLEEECRELDIPPPRRSQVGRYELGERLAQGGQAFVHLAWDPRLQREIVIKISRRSLGTGTASCCRIAQEGAVLAQLDHPRIVRVLDVGTHRGYPYLVQERVPGTTLLEAFANRPASTAQTRRILTQVATALSLAHEKGVLHLDLKPENVLIDEQGKCTLIDFGMSWILNKRIGPRLTFAAGTLHYMAPEQRHGETELWCPATDVYGLGCLLHFLKTGRPPGIDPLNSKDGLAPMREKVSLPFLQRSLTTICRKALSPEIENRYEDAADFLQALRWW